MTHERVGGSSKLKYKVKRIHSGNVLLKSQVEAGVN